LVYVLNAILPGNDYTFGKNPDGDSSRGVSFNNIIEPDTDVEKESE
jgi:uracil permease